MAISEVQAGPQATGGGAAQAGATATPPASGSNRAPPGSSEPVPSRPAR